LSDRTCRWPVGDPGNSDFFFCGAQPFRNKPYCAAHCARAYRPEQHTTQRAPSARLRRAMLKYLGIDTYIKLRGEIAAEWQWAEEGGCATEQDDRIYGS
jgi:GcrA cell cycle regulator